MVPHPTPPSTQGKIQSPCQSAPQVIFSLLSGDLLSFPPRMHSAPEVLAGLLFSAGPFSLSGLARFLLCPVASRTDCLWLFISVRSLPHQGLPGGFGSKESACNTEQIQRLGFDPWVKKIPWRREWQLTVVFLPGESHG